MISQSATPRNVVRLAAAVAAPFATDVAAVFSHTRRRPAVLVRQIVMAMMVLGVDRDGRTRTLPQVGRIMGRDHTTVLHAVRRHGRICAAAGISVSEGDATLHAERLAAHLGFIREGEALPNLSDPALPDAIDPPEEFVPMPIAVPALPAVLADGRDFGVFDTAGWRDLPEPMQREGVLLFLERDGAERPQSGEEARLARAARAFRVSRETLAHVLDSHARHELQREDVIEALDVVAKKAAPTDGNSADRETRFGSFAAVMLVAERDGRVSVRDTYAAYLQFCAATPSDLLPRSQFGFELRRIASGAAREGDIQHGVSLRVLR